MNYSPLNPPKTTVKRGRQFLQVPGPTNIPDRVLNAMHRPAMDVYKGFTPAKEEAIHLARQIFQTEQQVAIYASSGHGAWEAALVNVLNPGEKVLIPVAGNFSKNWGVMARAHNIEVEEVEGDWRKPVDPAAVEERLRADTNHEIKAVAMVQVDTATGIWSDVEAVRKAIDAANHPALFLVDVIACLATTDFQVDNWGVDVGVAGSQKGLMGPPGLGLCSVSEKAIDKAMTVDTPRHYFSWKRAFADRSKFRFSGTAPEHAIWGTIEGMRMVLEEGLDQVFARHHRLAEAVRRCVAHWAEGGALEFVGVDPDFRSNAVTSVLVPENFDPDLLLKTADLRYDTVIAQGLGKFEGRTFRIGHMGELNPPMILGALAGIEMAMQTVGLAHKPGGVQAAMDYIAKT
ncbi:MAG: aminotransferase class V-fold PLP-dependent enzyme [Alphaproteobacteria bacterium]|nr:aminotransferase class V-fold PLP-dependent enzyme [Alphaproteobacteria bacterium]